HHGLDVHAVRVHLVRLFIALPDARLLLDGLTCDLRDGRELLPARDIESEEVAGLDAIRHVAARALESVAGEPHFPRLPEDLGTTTDDPASHAGPPSDELRAPIDAPTHQCSRESTRPGLTVR